MATIESVTQDLKTMVDNLDPKNLQKAVRGALRTEANKCKREAVKVLRTMPMHNAAAVARNIRSGAMRNLSGYYVSVRSKGKKAMHTNTRGLEKPVAFWWHTGTKNRKTKGGNRKAHATGGTRAYDFMSAAHQKTESSADRLGDAFAKQVKKITDRTFR